MGNADAKTSKIKDASEGTFDEDKQTVFGRMLPEEEANKMASQQEVIVKLLTAEEAKGLAFKQKNFATSEDDRISETPNLANSYVEWHPSDSRGNGFCKLRDEYKCKKPRKKRKNMTEEEIQKQEEEDEKKKKKGEEKYKKVKEILDENNIDGIEYKNGVPDFSPVAVVTMEISYDEVQINGSTGDKARKEIQSRAYKQFAKYLNEHKDEAKELGFDTNRKILQTDIKKYMDDNSLTWHELNDCKHIQLVPTLINDTFGHYGGIGEVNHGALKEGGFAYNENLKKAERVTEKRKKVQRKTTGKAEYPPGKG